MKYALKVLTHLAGKGRALMKVRPAGMQMPERKSSSLEEHC